MVVRFSASFNFGAWANNWCFVKHVTHHCRLFLAHQSRMGWTKRDALFSAIQTRKSPQTWCLSNDRTSPKSNCPNHLITSIAFYYCLLHLLKCYRKTFEKLAHSWPLELSWTQLINSTQWLRGFKACYRKRLTDSQNVFTLPNFNRLAALLIYCHKKACLSKTSSFVHQKSWTNLLL